MEIEKKRWQPHYHNCFDSCWEFQFGFYFHSCEYDVYWCERDRQMLISWGTGYWNQLKYDEEHVARLRGERHLGGAEIVVESWDYITKPKYKYKELP